jgi:hypothetical protein
MTEKGLDLNIPENLEIWRLYHKNFLALGMGELRSMVLTYRDITFALQSSLDKAAEIIENDKKILEEGVSQIESLMARVEKLEKDFGVSL